MRTFSSPRQQSVLLDERERLGTVENRSERLTLREIIFAHPDVVEYA